MKKIVKFGYDMSVSHRASALEIAGLLSVNTGYTLSGEINKVL